MNTLPDQFVIKIHNADHYRAVQLRLFELDIAWDGMHKNLRVDTGIKHVLVRGNEMMHSFNDPLLSKDWSVAPVIILDQLYNLQREKNIRVVLNDSYVATVSKKRVRINHPKGFEPAKILELETALASLNAPLAANPLFKEEAYIEIKSTQHAEAIQKRLIELGFVWYGTEENKVCDIESDATAYGLNAKNGWNTNSNQKPNIHRSPDRSTKKITIDDLYNVPDAPTSVSVKLNSEWTAVITKDRIKVGCQEFNVSVIAGLKKAYNEVNS